MITKIRKSTFENLRQFIVVILILLLYSCGDKDSAEITTVTDDTTQTSNNNPVDEIPEIGSPAAPDSSTVGAINPSSNAPVKLEDYKVILATDEKVYLNETCELKIWIGAEEVKVTFSDGMITDQSTIPASIGQYAKITPYAPGFEVSPIEMKCIKVDPSGSEVRFTLKPKESGNLKVSANIDLYNNAECSGPPIPKTSKTLMVNVEIDRNYVVNNGMKEMATVVWDKFLIFWGVLIALVFAALLFVIRRFVKKKTGYEDKP